MNVFTKLRRRLSPPADPEAEQEKQRGRARREDVRDRARAHAGPRGIGGLAPPKRDVDDPRR
jgi:hypothetical protein